MSNASRVTCSSLALALALCVGACQSAAPPPAPAAPPPPAPETPTAAAQPAPAPDYKAAATAVYIAGYPAVEIARTRLVGTNVAEAGPMRAPINQFAHGNRLITADDRDVVTPNNDTPYSGAFLDLKQEPLVLQLPKFGKRYYTVPFLDAYHEHFASIGQRAEAATGELAIAAPDGGTFLITGPGFTGAVPEGMRQVPSPTNDVWVIMRPLVDGPKDMPALMALKKQIKLVPLSQWGKQDYTPSENTVKTLDPEVAELGKPLTGLKFYEVLGEVIKNNPLGPAEQKLKDQLALVGLSTDKGFDASQMSDAAREQLIVASQEAAKTIEAEVPKLGVVKHGWRLPNGHQGLFHGDTLRRAAFAYVGLGVINSEEALYPMATTDEAGQPLVGSNVYELRFSKDQLPQAGAFWSLTMYGTDKFLVKNELKRHSLGDRSKLKYDKDGSLTLYIQHQDPGWAKRANWLPTPEGGFYLVLRLYHPSPAAQRGEYVPPPVKQVTKTQQ